MSNENLTCNITTSLANVTSSCTTEELLSIALAASDNADTNRQISVAKTCDLPDLYLNNIPEGTVMFLENYNVPVIATKTSWEGLDGQLIRKDVPNLIAWAWGCNNCGQLGDTSLVNKSSPVSVVGGFTDWNKIVSGGVHSLGLKRDGTIWAWGNGSTGQLGDTSLVNKSSPVSVVGGFTDWCDTDASVSSSVGIRTNGTAWAWGQNGGKLGDGTYSCKSSPVSVVGGFTDWRHISIGNHSIGLRANGTLWTWGRSNYGELGDGTTINKCSPVSALGGFTDWCQASSGSIHSLGVRSNGTAWTWGNNRYGKLGNNTTIGTSSPISVGGGFTDWRQLSGGSEHSLGLRANGTLWAWGYNIRGMLGDGKAINRSSPVSVVGGFTDWCTMSGGYYHSVGIRTNGTIWSWGYNRQGQLGDGTTLNKCSPVSIIGGLTNWSNVSTSTKSKSTIGIVAV